MKKLIRPTTAESRKINAAIAADPDTYELSAEEFKQLKPVFPRGRPKSERTKVPITVRLDPEVVAFFRVGGDGWQTRLNAFLAAHVKRKTHAAGKRAK